MPQPSVMVRMISRGNPDARAAANLFCYIAKVRPKWDIAVHVNRLSVALARNEVVAEARQARTDFLIMLDDDVVPTESVVNLPDHDLPVVSGLVPFWKAGHTYLNAFNLSDDSTRLLPISSWTPGQLLRVYAVGGAILCVRKEIVSLTKAYPLFQFITLPSGVMAERGGEDIAFCRKMRAWNVPVHVDPDVQGRHHCIIDLHQTLLTQGGLSANPDPNLQLSNVIDGDGVAETDRSQSSDNSRLLEFPSNPPALAIVSGGGSHCNE